MLLRRKRLLIGSGSGLVAAVLAWVWVGGTREPQYQGRTLMEWGTGLQYGPTTPAAEIAVRNIGTNALPILIEWVRRHPAEWKLKLRQTLTGVPLVGQRWGSVVAGWFDSGLSSASDTRGFLCFGALAELATPACPGLARIMIETKSALVRWKAANSLARIGPSALPFLLAALTNETNHIELRQGAARAVGTMGTNAMPAVAVFAEFVNGADAGLTRVVVLSPVLLLDPQISVPALAGGLQSTNDLVRLACATSLRRFEGRGARAVPALVQCLNDPSPKVRMMATNALRTIAPWELIEGKRLRWDDTNFDFFIFHP